jgi:hypothetical protein
VLYAIEAVFFVQFENDFGVTLRREPVPLSQKLFGQFDKIENLTVKGNPSRPRCVGHRLVAAAEVDDAEPRVSEAHGTVGVNARIVGSAMPNLTNHSPKLVRIDRRAVQMEDA